MEFNPYVPYYTVTRIVPIRGHHGHVSFFFDGMCDGFFSFVCLFAGFVCVCVCVCGKKASTRARTRTYTHTHTLTHMNSNSFLIFFKFFSL